MSSSPRLVAWWERNRLAWSTASIPKAEWEELDAAIREDEREKSQADLYAVIKVLTAEREDVRELEEIVGRLAMGEALSQREAAVVGRCERNARAKRGIVASGSVLP